MPRDYMVFNLVNLCPTRLTHVAKAVNCPITMILVNGVVTYLAFVSGLSEFGANNVAES